MKVIKKSCLPTKIPIIGTIVAYLFLDHINAPQIVWGAVGILYLIWWVVVIAALYKSDYVDIFK